MSIETPTAGIAHPEWVGGRRLWLDPALKDVIDKIHHGDPVKGWEGDPRLAVYALPTPVGLVWELVRLEDDEQYRHVHYTEPNQPLDDRIIDWLLANDARRRPNGYNLAAEIEKANDALDRERDAKRDEWVAEEIAPRLRHALRKDGLL